MKKVIAIMALTVAALWMSGCGAPPANNGNGNTNTNSNSKPTAAAPTADALLALEQQANDSYIKADTKWFQDNLSDKAVMKMGKDPMGKAAIIDMISKAKCDGASVKLSEGAVSKIDNDTYAFTYKIDGTGKCADEKGAMTELKPTRAATVWVRNGEKWQAVWHSENLIVDPKAASAGNKPAADKKEEPKKEEPKKDDKAAANSNSASNSSAPAPAGPAKSANTDALTKTHNAGWEAFMKKDATWFNANLTDSATNVDPMGGVITGKANVVKNWTETMKCEGITKASFTEGFAVSISPTTEILFGKGNADGKCDGQPNGDLWQTAFYTKEGDAWKLAFMFESLPNAGM
ncbi:MAG: nuclear transport factor 2 family protein [Acidobacteria bacterium]|nr:nuclear transport factor 2 family protein [Acidobacteriota bacterium]